MIDINNIVNTAIQQEINKAITNYVDAYMADVQQEHRRQIAALREEIEQLKQQPAPTTSTTTPVTPELAQDVLRLLTDSPSIKQAVHEIAHNAAEAMMADHLEAYEHDEYDRVVRFIDEDLPSDFPDFDDFITNNDMTDAVREAVRHTLENSLSVSLHLC